MPGADVCVPVKNELICICSKSLSYMFNSVIYSAPTHMHQTHTNTRTHSVPKTVHFTLRLHSQRKTVESTHRENLYAQYRSVRMHLIHGTFVAPHTCMQRIRIQTLNANQLYQSIQQIQCPSING